MKNKSMTNKTDLNISSKVFLYTLGMIFTNVFFIITISTDSIRNGKQMIIEGFPKVLLAIFMVLIVTESILDGTYNLFLKKIEKKRIYMHFITSPIFGVWNITAIYFLSAEFWAKYTNLSFEMFIGIYLFLCVSLFYFMNRFLSKISKIQNQNKIES